MKKIILYLVIICLRITCFGQLDENNEVDPLEFRQMATMSGNKFKLYLNDELISDIQYDEVKSFKEGLAAVKREGKWCYINTDGIEIIPPSFFDCTDYSNGFAVVMDNSQNKGFINKNGKLITPIKYFSARFFVNGFAAVSSGTYPNLKWGFIDSTGKEIIALKYSNIDDFEGGIAKVYLGNKSGYVNNLGKEISPVIYYSYSRNLGNGMATLILDINNRLSFEGVVNKNGELVIKKGQFDGVRKFSDKYLIVEKNSKYGITDLQGNIKIEINFFDIKPLTDENEESPLGRLYLERGQFFYVNEKLECVNIEGSQGMPCP